MTIYLGLLGQPTSMTAPSIDPEVLTGSLNAEGKLIISVANADLYKAEGSFQENPGGQSGIHRTDHTNESQIVLEADMGPAAHDKVIAYKYWL